ncbi:Histidine decarboxylase [Orchesella cincta]|uniref:Histidine decarboxylase n=1 Tax=Orchesella cincta TaxID=48709 RepID=A0A1D2M3P8_ORCCI|nr:Histidine decarboxylase [Orchesella cincta]
MRPAHSSVEKAGLIGLVRMHYLDSDEESYSIGGESLSFAIRKDRENGLIPFWVCATLGTTGSCAFDNLEELGTVCRQESMRNILIHKSTQDFIAYLLSLLFPDKTCGVHCDCAYAGARSSGARIPWLDERGRERPTRWHSILPSGSWFILTALQCGFKMLEHFIELSMWILYTFNMRTLEWRLITCIGKSLSANGFEHSNVVLWLRSFGVQGLQEHIRKSVRLAARFEAMVAADSRFEISAKRHLGLVVFRLRGDNELTETLLKRLNASGKIHCVPASLKGRYVIRFTITSPQTTVEDICTDWAVVKETARAVLSNEIFQWFRRKKMNGSFAAIFDSNELFKEFERKLKLSEMDNSSPAVVRRRIKGMIMAGKQYSLDSRMDIVSTMHSNKDSVEEDDKGRFHCFFAFSRDGKCWLQDDQK